jgi:hypothetical protein
MITKIEMVDNNVQHTRVIKHKEYTGQVPVDELVKALVELQRAMSGNAVDKSRLSLVTNGIFIGFPPEVQSSIEAIIDFKTFLKDKAKTASLDWTEVRKTLIVLTQIDSKVREAMLPPSQTRS